MPVLVSLTLSQSMTSERPILKRAAVVAMESQRIHVTGTCVDLCVRETGLACVLR